MDRVKLQQALVQHLGRSDIKIVAALTGGGTKGVSDLMCHPGASQSVLDIAVPYSAPAMVSYLGYTPSQYCSASTASSLAFAAFRRVRCLGGNTGIGITCSLATERPKRGDHRYHIALVQAERIMLRSVTLSKGLQSREGEEGFLAADFLSTLGKFTGWQKNGLEFHAPEDAEQIELHKGSLTLRTFDRSWMNVMLGMTSYVSVNCKIDRKHKAIFPGSFNPMHEGHIQVKAIAEKMLHTPVICEISLQNVEHAKSVYDIISLLDRRAMIGEVEPFLLSQLSSFLEKAEAYQPATFVVGMDTLLRILNPAYPRPHGSSVLNMLQYMRQIGTRFLVFGRKNAEGEFRTLSDLSLDMLAGGELEDRMKVLGTILGMSDEVPADMFRCDLSSTEIRASSERMYTEKTAVV